MAKSKEKKGVFLRHKDISHSFNNQSGSDKRIDKESVEQNTDSNSTMSWRYGLTPLKVFFMYPGFEQITK